jgi:uncharacterized membrane protein (DUF2068 family)
LTVDWRNYREVLLRSRWLQVIMAILITYSALDLINPAGGSSLYVWFGFVARQFFFPFLIYSMVRTVVRGSRRAFRFLLYSLLAIGVLQVYLSYLQVSTDGKQGYL